MKKKFMSGILLTVLLATLVAIPVSAAEQLQQYGKWVYGISGFSWDQTVFSNYSHTQKEHSATVKNGNGVVVSSGWVEVSSRYDDLNAKASATAYWNLVDHCYYNVKE